ncbi:DUF4189 domain-containing protein [Nocardia sp. NPDC051832]|uniref:DUF4189 domain-containing protein n=1 Tax=Nocardia sp. NPDC051832 TaxID=3155673 RepID=UPI0034204381
MKKMLATAAGFAAVGLSTLFTYPATAQADSYTWGAIAYSPSELIAKASWNHSTAGSAQSRALSACGRSDCRMAVTFTRCGAVAHSRANRRVSWAEGNSVRQAEANALRYADSRILRSLCTR